MTDVLLLLEYASLNGGERSLLAALQQLIGGDFRFTALAQPTGPLAEELQRLSIGIEPFATHDSSGRRFSQDELRERLRHVLAARRPDLLHANSLSMSRLCGPVADELGVPCLGHLRDILRLSAAAVADLNRNRRLLAVSQATRRWYVDQGVAEERLQVLYNGVDLQCFAPRPKTGYLHRELNLPAEAVLLAAIGQVGMRKGLDVVLQAAARVFSGNPASHLLIVGQRYSQKEEAVRYEDDLRQAAAVAPLAGRVHFIGVREDIPRLLNELTLLVHAARQEPLGRVLLEAAASGLPVIATDVGGTSEIFAAVEGAESARLIQPDDADALAGEVDSLLRDLNLRSRLAAAARRRAETHFSAAESARCLADHYFELINRT